MFASSGNNAGKGGAKNHAGGATHAAGAGGTGGNSGAGGAAAGAGGSAGKAGASGAAGAGGNAGASGNAGTSGNAASAGAVANGGTGGGGASDLGGNGGASGGADGSGGASMCGDGVIEAGEQCDGMGPTATCSNTCVKVSNAACVACESAGDCSGFADNCLGVGTPFTADQQSACYSVMACIISSRCLVGTGSLGGSCYCGSLALMACQAAPFDLSKPGAPNGPCAAAIQAGMPSVTSNATVLGSLTGASRPAGAAMQRLNCQKTAGNGECGLPCGLTSFP